MTDKHSCLKLLFTVCIFMATLSTCLYRGSRMVWGVNYYCQFFWCGRCNRNSHSAVTNVSLTEWCSVLLSVCLITSYNVYKWVLLSIDKFLFTSTK